MLNSKERAVVGLIVLFFGAAICAVVAMIGQPAEIPKSRIDTMGADLV